MRAVSADELGAVLVRSHRVRAGHVGLSRHPAVSAEGPRAAPAPRPGPRLHPARGVRGACGQRPSEPRHVRRGRVAGGHPARGRCGIGARGREDQVASVDRRGWRGRLRGARLLRCVGEGQPWA